VVRRARLLQSTTVAQCTLFTGMSDREPEVPELPNRWQEIQAEQTYGAAEGLLVSFSPTQIQLRILYDAFGKHLRAINKGLVSPKGNSGLVPSEELEFDLKSKILGKGGDRRFHGRMVEGILHFPGKMTHH
jgi:hypothetical protein